MSERREEETEELMRAGEKRKRSGSEWGISEKK